MNRYPFIVAALPEIKIGAKPEVSFKEVKELLSMNLIRKDMEKVNLLLKSVDLENIRSFWLGLPLNEWGTLNGKELEEALLVKDSFPPFLVEFLDRYDTTEERLHNFPSLYASLYRDLAPELSGFLKQYYHFERELRLILTALRAKKWGRDVVRELQFEDPHDPFIMQILVQKDSAEYVPPKEYEDLKELFMENSSDPLKLHRALSQYRFDRILEIEEGYSSFTIDRILGFLARLMIVEMWNQMNKEKGLSLIDDLSKNG
ncbi:MAG: DUF2764 family protein [Verrucomicrobia bacterium]|nr:DUF2764 family protein [Verrucomicrobiota bacterium]